jgi:hypothetical protein
MSVSGKVEAQYADSDDVPVIRLEHFRLVLPGRMSYIGDLKLPNINIMGVNDPRAKTLGGTTWQCVAQPSSTWLQAAMPMSLPLELFVDNFSLLESPSAIAPWRANIIGIVTDVSPPTLTSQDQNFMAFVLTVQSNSEIYHALR